MQYIISSQNTNPIFHSLSAPFRERKGPEWSGTCLKQCNQEQLLAVCKIQCYLSTSESISDHQPIWYKHDKLQP